MDSQAEFEANQHRVKVEAESKSGGFILDVLVEAVAAGVVAGVNGDPGAHRNVVFLSQSTPC